jgi:hypothetical protein
MEQKQYDELVKLIDKLTEKVNALEYLLTEHLGDPDKEEPLKDILEKLQDLH